MEKLMFKIHSHQSASRNLPKGLSDTKKKEEAGAEPLPQDSKSMRWQYMKSEPIGRP